MKIPHGTSEHISHLRMYSRERSESLSDFFRMGLTPSREGPGDGPSRCGPSITADRRSEHERKRKTKTCFVVSPQNTFSFLFPTPDRPSAVMDGPQHEGPSPGPSREGANPSLIFSQE